MSIQPLTSKAEIRSRLERDREWSLYALADLDDGMFEHCEWWGGEDDSIALVFRALPIRPIFVAGGAVATRELLAAVAEPNGYLNLQRHQVEAARGLWTYRECHRMNRMIMRNFLPGAGAGVVALGPEDAREVEGLYAAGDGGGLAFAPFQLATGVFRGVRGGDGRLVAVAGVHVLSRAESVAGVGNVFTHPEHRGRGYARAVTSAVVVALGQLGIKTIGLNVEHDNGSAIRVYERLGFRTSFDYFEGVAERRKDGPARRLRV